LMMKAPVSGHWSGRSALMLKTFKLLDFQRKQQIRRILRILQTGESSYKRYRPTTPTPVKKTHNFASIFGTASGKSVVGKWIYTPVIAAPPLPVAKTVRTTK